MSSSCRKQILLQKEEQLKEQLRQANGELEQIRKVMEGRKELSKASQYKPKSRF